jgi:hypothetical protein
MEQSLERIFVCLSGWNGEQVRRVSYLFVGILEDSILYFVSLAIWFSTCLWKKKIKRKKKINQSIIAVSLVLSWGCPDLSIFSIQLRHTGHAVKAESWHRILIGISE